MFTSSIIAILTISRAIIQSCMGGSGWFGKGTELSSIINYYLSNISIVYKNLNIAFGAERVKVWSYHMLPISFHVNLLTNNQKCSTSYTIKCYK